MGHLLLTTWAGKVGNFVTINFPYMLTTLSSSSQWNTAVKQLRGHKYPMTLDFQNWWTGCHLCINPIQPQIFASVFLWGGSSLLRGKVAKCFGYSNSWISNSRDPLGWSQPMQILKFKQTCMPSLTPKIFQTCVLLATPSVLSLDHNSKVQKAEGSPTPVWAGFQLAVSSPIAMSTWFWVAGKAGSSYDTVALEDATLPPPDTRVKTRKMVATASRHEKVLIFALYGFDGTKGSQETSPNTVAKIQQYFERKLCLPKLATFSVPLFQIHSHSTFAKPTNPNSKSQWLKIIASPKVVLYQYQVWFWLKAGSNVQLIYRSYPNFQPGHSSVYIYILYIYIFHQKFTQWSQVSTNFKYSPPKFFFKYICTYTMYIYLYTCESNKSTNHHGHIFPAKFAHLPWQPQPPALQVLPLRAVVSDRGGAGPGTPAK